MNDKYYFAVKTMQSKKKNDIMKFSGKWMELN